MEKIIFEREKCIGCGACAAVCSAHFKMADDGKSELIDSKSVVGNFEKETEDAACAKNAEEGCPVQCIHVK